jgi:hypothetical protein
MATQYVMTPAVPNRSLSAKLYTTAMVEQATASSITETVSNSGIYEVVFTEASALSGSFRLAITDILTGYGVASYEAFFAGVDGERINASEYHALGSADDKLNDILAKITPITTVYSPQPSSETISLIRGDAYDGTANAKLSWTASKDVDGETVNFTIRDSKDVIILDQDTAGVTTLATGSLVEVSLSTAATELLDPAVSIFTFDVEIEFSAGSRWTITKGNVCVESDVSR